MFNWHKCSKISTMQVVQIVAGGCTLNCGVNPGTNDWRTGASLPNAIFSVSSVSGDGSMVIVGSQMQHEYADSILEYIPDDTG